MLNSTPSSLCTIFCHLSESDRIDFNKVLIYTNLVNNTEDIDLVKTQMQAQA